MSQDTTVTVPFGEVKETVYRSVHGEDVPTDVKMIRTDVFLLHQEPHFMFLRLRLLLPAGLFGSSNVTAAPTSCRWFH